MELLPALHGTLQAHCTDTPAAVLAAVQANTRNMQLLQEHLEHRKQLLYCLLCRPTVATSRLQI